MPSWRGHGKTLILHNKQIPWNMSGIENMAIDDTEKKYIYIYVYTHRQTQVLNFNFWAENWQKAFHK
jgi:hypothetical protein